MAEKKKKKSVLSYHSRFKGRYLGFLFSSTIKAN